MIKGAVRTLLLILILIPGTIQIRYVAPRGLRDCSFPHFEPCSRSRKTRKMRTTRPARKTVRSPPLVKFYRMSALPLFLCRMRFASRFIEVGGFHGFLYVFVPSEALLSWSDKMRTMIMMEMERRLLACYRPCSGCSRCSRVETNPLSIRPPPPPKLSSRLRSPSRCSPC